MEKLTNGAQATVRENMPIMERTEFNLADRLGVSFGAAFLEILTDEGLLLWLKCDGTSFYSQVSQALRLRKA
jgi:hypothetical protein